VERQVQRVGGAGERDLVPVEPRRAHVDADAAVAEALGREVAGGGADYLVGAAVLLEQEFGHTARGVAAGARLGAVGVADAHEQVGVGLGRRGVERDELVAADPDLPVREAADLVGRELEWQRALVDDDEVVTGAVHLDEGDRHVGVHIGHRRPQRNVAGCAPCDADICLPSPPSPPSPARPAPRRMRSGSAMAWACSICR
jgi:hypothetical protein